MSAVSPSPSILLTSTKPSNETHKTIIIPFIKKPTIPTIQCEFRSFENNSSSYQNLIADSSNRIHIIFKPPSSSPLTTASSMDLSIKHSKRVCLFYCSEMKDLAERIASASDSIELRGITWRTFEDGFPNLFISNAHGIRGQRVAFLASFSSPGVIFEQLSIIYALPKLFVSSFTLVLPFFPTGTFERMEEEGDVATAFTLARILSNIPISRGGPTSLVIFDIHALQVCLKSSFVTVLSCVFIFVFVFVILIFAKYYRFNGFVLQERFYFGDNILPCFESGIPLLLNRLQKLPDSDNIAIAFPDDGAWKRFHKQLQHFPTIVCIKVREGDQRIVRLKEGDPKGRHVVIVDDLVQSGGTLLECQKVLANHGATKISAYVTHGIFPNSTWERFKHDAGGNPENGMTYFWITDSCPRTVKQVENKSPFEILSLAAPIAAALQV
ncbi:ribose-phosphate pyrophosphokinase 4-like isoform X1 [Olea europaea subsp. europaea]|uniref:Ribose-phosphate pyrophosphokinase 4-like isoform X1 n=1 Tax=Olea europaea subsp. europaea TaxID=158383 RepID=A0A8S0RU99_OLEEU|nr:ribose-phosphate pyrophosphokinase 4-like isoform X1 [Olea europaea subsp. europaea]